MSTENEQRDMAKILEYESTQKALADVQKRQLPIPRELSDDEKKFAEEFDRGNVSDLTDTMLMHAMTVFTNFRAYAAWELAKADIERMVAKATYDFTLSLVIMKYAPDAKTRKEKEDWAKMQGMVHGAERKVLQAEAYYRLLEPLVTGYDEKARVCSRELTRRTAPSAVQSTFYRNQT